MILTELHPDECAQICGIAGGAGLRQQLCLRGCSQGCTVRMISSSCGPVIVWINGSTLALGRGMAQKITVKKC